MSTIAIIPIPGIPQVHPGDDLPSLLLDAIDRAKVGLKSGDILVICQKVVSKAEGAVVNLKTIEPSAFAQQIATMWEKDPRLVEVVLRESSRIIRMKNGVIITETKQGWVCANAGVDESNSLGEDIAIVLPQDPDTSARTIRVTIQERRGITIGVIITDTFGRPWRDGLVEFALGVSGFAPLLDLRGTQDLQGRELHHTVVAVADELAAAAGLVMEKGAAVPAVIIRGYQFIPAEGDGKQLLRPAEADLFR
ncbi:MAG: coenzyme F420-0:L-glutamate ligase [Deltaproteobacteria bacterium]|nr:coenzyme F420-0:L-glutamate ligase [Deltaproteobacteria bacterium]